MAVAECVRPCLSCAVHVYDPPSRLFSTRVMTSVPFSYTFWRAVTGSVRPSASRASGGRVGVTGKCQTWAEHLLLSD